jgi:TP901 family phage tail tape measure protein
MQRQLQIILSADPRRIARDLNKATSVVKSFASKTRSMIGGIGGLLGIGAGTASFGFMANNFIRFEHALNAYRNSSSDSIINTMKLRDSIQKLAVDTGASREELVEYVSAIGDMTGNFDYAKGSAEKLAKTTIGTSSNMKDVSTVLVGLSNNFGATTETASKFIDIITGQGEVGKFVFKDIAAGFNEISASAQLLGIKDMDQFSKFMAFAQVARPSMSNAETTKTAIKNIAQTISTETKKINKLTGFDPSKKQDFADKVKGIVAGVVKKGGGDRGKVNAALKEIFGADAIMAWTGIVDEYMTTLKFATYDSLALVKAQGQVNTKFEDMIKNDKLSRLNRLNETMKKFGDILIAPAVTGLLDELQLFLDDEKKIKEFETAIRGLADGLKILADGFMLVGKAAYWVINDIWGGFNEFMANQVFGTTSDPEKQNIVDQRNILKGQLVGMLGSLPNEKRESVLSNLPNYKQVFQGASKENQLKHILSMTDSKSTMSKDIIDAIIKGFDNAGIALEVNVDSVTQEKSIKRKTKTSTFNEFK